MGLLPLLNPPEPRQRDVESLLGHLAGIPEPMEGVKAVAQTEIREGAILEFQTTLRDLVDQWIDSGRQGEKERPWKRNFEHISPKRGESLRITLLRFWLSYPPQVHVTGNTQAISMNSRFLFRPPSWEYLADTPVSKLVENARDHAIALFAEAMDSPSRVRIFRCEECHLYFAKERMPKKGVVIEGGSYCYRKRCKSEASKRRVERAREDRPKRMIGWAVDAQLAYKPSRRLELKYWVVEQVRKKQPHHEKPISVNWYTRHHVEIEAKAKAKVDGGRKKGK